MTIRRAAAQDISAVSAIYDEIHAAEEAEEAVIGWARGVYPTEKTAQAALERGDLFVQEDEGRIVGAAIINRQQVDSYHGAKWTIDAPDDQIMVLHTLVISPKAARKGYGRRFVAFYEDYASTQGCTALRMDTNARNSRARAMYRKLGYTEADIVPCAFNGIPGVSLVLLEKALG